MVYRKKNFILGQLENIEFVVILTRYQDKWVFCWHSFYLALVNSLGELPDNEMEKIELFDSVPENFTYDREDALVDLKMALNILKAWEKH